MGWYVIFAETGYEDEACFFINKISASIFYDIKYKFLLPQRKIYERKQGIKKEVVKKLFPGYIFVETDEIVEFYYRIKGRPHIIRVLRNDILFHEIELNEIYQIIYMANDDGVIGISKAFIINERVSVTQGPLMGQEGIIRKLDKRKGRAKVEFLLNYNKYWIDLGIDILGKYDGIEDPAEFENDLLSRNNREKYKETL